MSDDARDQALAQTLAPGTEDGRAETVAATPAAGSGADDGMADTVAVTPSTGSPRQVAVGATALDDEGERYRHGKSLGRGGMGEIAVADDLRIGREVAVKTLRGSIRDDQGSWARFVREARVQGQLEHPAIVPVYDLGVGDDGAPYFTMKRLRGLTLEQVLAALAAGDPEATRNHSQRKRLTLFAQVCQAVHFAHTRGVVHRDLKPANIMLGNFGEVYVLDWGVARLAGVGDEPGALVSGEGGSGVRTGEVAHTSHGAVIGTPGYMAPEQVRGEVERVDARSDVYGLGAILFELLTLLPLHDRSGSESLLRATLDGADARASVRAPDREVAPELEAICVRATATEPEDRYPDAATLVAEVERYLDGDRDLARRRELATEHAASAAADAERARAGDHEARKRALREAGRALALDPGNQDAAAIMTRLFVEPPTVVPDEVEATLLQLNRATHRREALVGAAMYGAQLLFVPLFVVMGVRSWAVLGSIIALIVVLGVQAAVVGLRNLESRVHMGIAVVLNTAALILLSRTLGPFVLAPGLIALSTIAYAFQQEVIPFRYNLTAGVAALVVPFVLEETGVWSSSYQFTDGVLVVRSAMLDLPPTLSMAFLALASIATVVSGVVFISQMMRLKHASERHLHLQTWQLRQLMPAHAHGAIAVVPDAPAPRCVRPGGSAGEPAAAD